MAGVLARERPALFRALPESFKIGLELPAYPGRARSPLRTAGGKPNPSRRARSDAPYPNQAILDLGEKSQAARTKISNKRLTNGRELPTVR